MKLTRGIRITAGAFGRLFLRSKRTRAFFVIGVIPAAILGIIRLVATLSRAADIPAETFFSGPLPSFFFQLLIPVLALFYGSTVVSDEIEDKTLVYLITRPAPRGGIFLGKALASCGVAALITAVSLIAAFLAADPAGLTSADRWGRFYCTFFVGLLAVFAYTALFALLGAFLKRPILTGLIFVFGWESIIQFMPGVTQKLTIIHYLKSLLPQIDKPRGPMTFHLEASGTVVSVLVPLLVGIVALLLGAWIFRRKEYIIAESNG